MSCSKEKSGCRRCDELELVCQYPGSTANKSIPKKEDDAGDGPHLTKFGNRGQSSEVDNTDVAAGNAAPQATNAIGLQNDNERSVSENPTARSPSLAPPLPSFHSQHNAFAANQQAHLETDRQIFGSTAASSLPQIPAANTFRGQPQAFNQNAPDQFQFSRAMLNQNARTPSLHLPVSQGYTPAANENMIMQTAAFGLPQDGLGTVKSNDPPNLRLQSQMITSLTQMVGTLEDCVSSELKPLEIALKITQNVLAQLNKFLDLQHGRLTFRSSALLHVAMSQAIVLLEGSVTHTFSGGQSNFAAAASLSPAQSSVGFNQGLFSPGPDIFTTNAQNHQISRARAVYNVLETCMQMVTRLMATERERLQASPTLGIADLTFAGSTNELNQNIEHISSLLPTM